MPRKKRENRQWTEPLIIVPIIVAVITAIVSPIIVPLIQDMLKEQTRPHPEDPTPPTPTSDTSSPSSTAADMSPSSTAADMSPSLSPSSTTPNLDTTPDQGDSLSFSTDKRSYGFGDNVRVSGTVDHPREGKNVRLDVYDPEPKIFNSYVFDPSNISTILNQDKPQSDIQVSPNEDGKFSYTFPLTVISPEMGMKGNYTVEATYEGLNKNATFTVR